LVSNLAHLLAHDQFFNDKDCLILPLKSVSTSSRSAAV